MMKLVALCRTCHIIFAAKQCIDPLSAGAVTEVGIAMAQPKIMKINTLSIVLATVLFCACKTQQPNLNYFSQGKADSSHRIWQSYEPVIQAGDRLSISVSALNPEFAKPYNIETGTGGEGKSTGGSILVEPDGRILYPQLGYITAEGLTARVLRDSLLNRLKKYLNDPVVSVQVLNSKVTVLGEVSKQGPVAMEDKRITILEAIGQAGDIQPTGRRDSVMVIREVKGSRTIGYVNLLRTDVFQSPYFVLQQNDVVYVPMNDKRARSESEQTFIRNLSVVTSILAVISTLGLLILNLSN